MKLDVLWSVITFLLFHYVCLGFSSSV